MHEEINEYSDEFAFTAAGHDAKSGTEIKTDQAIYVYPAPIVELESLFAWARLFAAQKNWRDQAQGLLVCFTDDGELHIRVATKEYQLIPQQLEALFAFIQSKDYSLRKILEELRQAHTNGHTHIASGLRFCVE